MTSSDITKSLDGLAESSRLLDNLLRIPDHQVSAILAILKDPAAVSSLSQLLRTVQDIRSEKKSKDASVSDDAPSLELSDRPIDWRRASRKDIMSELEIFLRTLFADQKRFPAVRDVHDFVKITFQIEISHKKLGRDRYIQKVLSAIQRSPRALHQVRNTMAHREVPAHDQAYAALYNFIRGRVTDQ